MGGIGDIVVLTRCPVYFNSSLWCPKEGFLGLFGEVFGQLGVTVCVSSGCRNLVEISFKF